MACVRIEDRDRDTWVLYDDRVIDRSGRALVVLGGAELAASRLLREVERAACVVAADGGAKACLAVGLVPDAVAGDLDSLDASTRARLDPERLAQVCDPETNDLEKALMLIAQRWPDTREVVLVAGGSLEGGRVDHAIANLGPLLAEPHRRISLVDGQGRLFALRHGRAKLEGLVGQGLSVLPWTLHGVRVTEIGLQFPLEQVVLQLGGRGISNSIADESACVEVHEGVALVWVEV